MENETLALSAEQEVRKPEQAEDDGWEWAIVEVMGHRSHVGRTREVERFGAKMLRVDVPFYQGRDANAGQWPPKIVDLQFDRWETHFYGGSAIFSFTPSDEESCRRAAKRGATVEPPAITKLAAMPDDTDDFDEVVDGRE